MKLQIIKRSLLIFLECYLAWTLTLAFLGSPVGDLRFDGATLLIGLALSALVACLAFGLLSFLHRRNERI